MSIEEFRLWATKLGCPPECMPCEESLKSVFKSPQRDLFINMMKRVQPRQDVKEIRENILVSKMDRMLMPVCGRNFLPKEMQTYLKIQDLKKRKEELENKLDEHRREYETLATSIKRKNLQSISLEHKHKMMDNKCTILSFKSKALDADIKREEQNRDRIIATMPVKLTSKNASEKEANQAVEKALKELELFYDTHSMNSKIQIPQGTKDDLWQKMRSIFANVPTFLIFNVIMRLKDEQLQNITTLKKVNCDDWQTQSLSSILTSCNTPKEPLTSFEAKLLKAKADLLALVGKYLSAREEHELLEQRFSNAYAPFVCEVQKKVNFLNAGNDEEHANEVISNFLIQYSASNFSKAENEYLAQQIEQLKVEIELGNKQLEKHEILLGSIKEVYANINSSINRIQYEMLQLGQIKDKIIYSKNLMKLMLDDLQAATVTAANNNANAKTHFLSTAMKMTGNSSILSFVGAGGGGDSFELGGDVFCSTKLDFDCTMKGSFNAAETTVLPSSSGNILPPHSAELNAFGEASLSCFSCVTPQCAIYFAPNPLVIESRELLSTIQLAPGILLTPHGALREVLMRSAATDLIAAHSSDFKLSLDLVNVDRHDFKQQLKRQREHVTELLDKIDITNVHTNHALQKLEQLYVFLHDNQLRHYIPKTKCFNNQTYADYEAEYTMYYRMATVGASFK